MIRYTLCLIALIAALVVGGCATEPHVSTATYATCVSDLQHSTATAEESIQLTKRALAVALTWKRRYYMLKDRTGR